MLIYKFYSNIVANNIVANKKINRNLVLKLILDLNFEGYIWVLFRINLNTKQIRIR